MSLKTQNTPDIIFQAALKEFHQNGFRGARTSRIAATAGISRTMLHYYFSTKEALFEAVLNKTFGSVLPHLHRMAAQDMGILALVENLVEMVADMLEENPGLPSFIVNILNESPELILNITAYSDENTPNLMDNLLKKAEQEGIVRAGIKGEHLVIDIWALCSTPYLVAPYIAAKEKRNPEQMAAFIRARRTAVVTLILNGIKKE